MKHMASTNCDNGLSSDFELVAMEGNELKTGGFAASATSAGAAADC